MRALNLKTILITLLVAVLATSSLVAFGADPQPVAPESSGKANPAEDAATQTGRSSVPDLKVNQAELSQNPELQGNQPAGTKLLKPMTIEINAMLDAAHVEVATLQERFDKEPNADAALALVRQIEQIKITAELDILRVQARYARADGNEDLAQKIETDLTQMTTPRPRRQPIERPASDAGNR